jgi:hypothetical protein
MQNIKKENILIDLLKQVKHVLDEHNIEFWLECGTLLGAIRNGTLIPWEHDLDFGVWSEKVSDNTKLSIAQKFSEIGFKVFVTDNYITIKNSENSWADINFYCLINDKAIVSLLGPKNLIGKLLNMFSKVLLVPYYYKIDFKTKPSIFIRSVFVVISRISPFFIRKKISRLALKIYESIGSKNVSWIVPSYYLKNLSTIKFYNMTFKIPAKSYEYLSYRYGKNWRVPKKGWVTTRDDGAVAEYYRK